MKKRHWQVQSDIETRDDDGVTKIRGYAAVFNELSEPMWGFQERIRPRAFRKTIKENDIRALFNHDTNIVLGRNRSGTLSLKEDKQGLLIEATPPDTQIVRDLVIAPIRRGDIDQMSFGFTVIKEEEMSENDILIRELVEVKLYDVSPVTFPAYPQTSVGLRAVDEIIDYIDSRHSEGSELNAGEIIYVREAIERLQSFLPETEPPEGHSDDGEPSERHSLEVLRARLDLAEIEV